MKHENKNSGKSKSSEFPHSKRRVKSEKELAPRSARKNGKIYLSECSQQELEIAGII
jgi:hypothetical protein